MVLFSLLVIPMLVLSYSDTLYTDDDLNGVADNGCFKHVENGKYLMVINEEDGSGWYYNYVLLEVAGQEVGKYYLYGNYYDCSEFLDNTIIYPMDSEFSTEQLAEICLELGNTGFIADFSYLNEGFVESEPAAQTENTYKSKVFAVYEVPDYEFYVGEGYHPFSLTETPCLGYTETEQITSSETPETTTGDKLESSVQRSGNTAADRDVNKIAGATISAGQENCKNQETCQELDRVWLSVANIIGTEDTVWDPVRSTWKSFENIYTGKTEDVVVLSSEVNVYSGTLEEDMNNLTDNQLGFIDKLNEICGELDINPVHLLAVMKFETGGTFSPTAKNPGSSAVGLIQFVESTAKGLDTTTSILSGMTAIQQLEYVKKYYVDIKEHHPNFDGQDLGDVAMAVIWPNAVGENDDYVLFSRGSDAYSKNSDLDVNNDGKVIKAEYVNWVIKKSEYYE